MIDAKQAVLIAKKQAASMLASGSTTLEEIEKDDYKGREVWSITLGLPWKASQLATIRKLPRESLFTGPLQYKRFLIDVETGDLVAIKLRELINA